LVVHLCGWRRVLNLESWQFMTKWLGELTGNPALGKKVIWKIVKSSGEHVEAHNRI
jgi:hypothetical protein